MEAYVDCKRFASSGSARLQVKRVARLFRAGGVGAEGGQEGPHNFCSDWRTNLHQLFRGPVNGSRVQRKEGEGEGVEEIAVGNTNRLGRSRGEKLRAPMNWRCLDAWEKQKKLPDSGKAELGAMVQGFGQAVFTKLSR